MHQTSFRYFILCLIVAIAPYDIPAQSISEDLGVVSGRVENYILQTRPEWKHELVPPATLPSPPSTTVIVHSWTSKTCGTTELSIDGTSYGTQLVPCQFRLVIDQSPSETVAQRKLSNFVRRQSGVTPISLGEKGYVCGDGPIVFIKGRFMFYVSGWVSLRLGEFSVSREFGKKMAKEVADVISDIEQTQRVR